MAQFVQHGAACLTGICLSCSLLTGCGGNSSSSIAPGRRTPQITWSAPAAILYGTALSSTQLNASASLPGTFAYSPAMGTVLNAGSQTLSATFTPTDDIDYTDATTSVTLDVASFGVAAWGDSLTEGMRGTNPYGYPSDLQKLITLPVENLGVGGQTSTQIGVREGGVPTYATVSGGVIPGTGGVAVTFPAGYEPVNSQGPNGGVNGTILGVHGNVSLASGIYTFTPTTAESAVNAPGSPQFIVDTPYASYFPVFWEGRNNYAEETQVLSDIAAQVATVPSGQNYLVMSVINMNSLSEWIGGGAYKKIVALNQQLANIYGSHYLDIREVLVDQYNPSLITDVSDYNHDEVPTSLRAIDGNGTLGSSIGPADTSIIVNCSSACIEAGKILTIDTGDNAENVYVSALTGDTVTVVRNYGGLDTSHAAGAQVIVTDLLHLNPNGYQVVANAVEQYLSENGILAEERKTLRAAADQ
jgi:lysophospholipase L1-like esterase